MNEAPAAHQAIVCVDVEKFTDQRRTNPHQLAVHEGLYQALHGAFDRAGVPWQSCYHEDRGDGALILVPPEVPKKLLVVDVLHQLAAALAEHNHVHDGRAQIRLRVALHAGEVRRDPHGVVSEAVNFTCRPYASAVAPLDDVPDASASPGTPADPPTASTTSVR